MEDDHEPRFLKFNGDNEDDFQLWSLSFIDTLVGKDLFDALAYDLIVLGTDRMA